MREQYDLSNTKAPQNPCLIPLINKYSLYSNGYKKRLLFISKTSQTIASSQVRNISIIVGGLKGRGERRVLHSYNYARTRESAS